MLIILSLMVFVLLILVFTTKLKSLYTACQLESKVETGKIEIEQASKADRQKLKNEYNINSDSEYTLQPSKNKWLYPDDEFGQMQKGVVINDKVYGYEIVKEIKNSTDT